MTLLKFIRSIDSLGFNWCYSAPFKTCYRECKGCIPPTKYRWSPRRL